MAQDILVTPPIEIDLFPNETGAAYNQVIKLGDEFWVVGRVGSQTTVWRGTGNGSWTVYGWNLLSTSGIEPSGNSTRASSGMLATDGENIFLTHLIPMQTSFPRVVDPTTGLTLCPARTNGQTSGMRVYIFDFALDTFVRINRSPLIIANPMVDDHLMGITQAADGGQVGFPIIAASPAEPGICHVVWSGIGHRTIQAGPPECFHTTHAQSTHIWSGGDYRPLPHTFGSEYIIAAAEVELTYLPDFASGHYPADEVTNTFRMQAEIFNDLGYPILVGAPWDTYNLNGSIGSPDYWTVSQPDAAGGTNNVIATIDKSDIVPPPSDPTYKPKYITVGDIFTDGGVDYRYIWSDHGGGFGFINRVVADFSAPPEAFEGDTTLSLLPGTPNAYTNIRAKAKHIPGREVWWPLLDLNGLLQEYGFTEGEWVTAYFDDFTFEPWGLTSHASWYFPTDSDIYFIALTTGSGWGVGNKWGLFSFNFGRVGFYHLESEPIIVVAP